MPIRQCIGMAAVGASRPKRDRLDTVNPPKLREVERHYALRRKLIMPPSPLPGAAAHASSRLPAAPCWPR